MNPLVTVVTATTGTKYVKQNTESVAAQTYKNIQHLVVVDGKEHEAKFKWNAHTYRKVDYDLITLPCNTGANGYNGHRIYGAATFLAAGDYIIFLDEDNWLEPNHIESLVANANKNTWGYSLRKIVDADGNYICNDDCESLGEYKSVIDDFFVDVNCFFFPKMIAVQLAPLWYRRARHPDDQPEVDRLLTHVLREHKIPSKGTGEYTVNYRAGNREDSVQAGFFLQGNEIMNNRYNGEFPWRKK